MNARCESLPREEKSGYPGQEINPKKLNAILAKRRKAMAVSVLIGERISRYVACLDPAVSGQRGHDRTFHMAKSI
jgi:hypothetical protein